ncbi:uncharacterized protein YndB with AHSA1/START domain [Pontibacter mucosus]|uniref:Uncharacterized protein YndB with AHSA1/START domain n=1 Tax=Pontibacter mucosus TaxID=1649266 RepID=A0A2T5YG12_9BACT|nr:SRPBCC domain-containing protein [Pontibacter mucosus]PTX18265.1 uncharacterized protein YndB with AHSA1/START domain [Pontibacter mucosus]
MEKAPEAVEATTGRAFILSRTFEADRETIFKAWTEEDQLAQWWGPKGIPLQIVRLDARPGGYFHYNLQLPDGSLMWGRFDYRELAEPERIVYVSAFSDEEGKVVRAPFSADWPLQILNIVTLEEENGRTTLTSKSILENATAAEQETFEQAFDSLRQGLTGTFDQLETYLNKV